MKKYRTGGWGKDLIEEVEVVKETAKQLVIVEEWMGKKRENRLNKISSYYQFHDTWQDAHNFLLSKAERNIAYAEKALASYKAQFEEIKGMVKP